jgi:hypothetical protein
LLIKVLVLGQKMSPQESEMAIAKVQENASGAKMQPSENRETSLVTEDAIAQRAYALYVARGCEDGHDVEDWLNAERELQEANKASSPEEI